jgi:hypothetical protein
MAEVRAARDALSKKAGYDLKKLYDLLKEGEDHRKKSKISI